MFRLIALSIFVAALAAAAPARADQSVILICASDEIQNETVVKVWHDSRWGYFLKEERPRIPYLQQHRLTSEPIPVGDGLVAIRENSRLGTAYIEPSVGEGETTWRLDIHYGDIVVNNSLEYHCRIPEPIARSF